MIRPVRHTEETCFHCKRGGWKHTNPYVTKTLEEAKELFGLSRPLKVDGLPKGYEPMWVGCGSIHEAVKEAIEYVKVARIKGAGFEFNGKLVAVTSKSDADDVVRKWWKEMYNETPEQSAARR